MPFTQTKTLLCLFSLWKMFGTSTRVWRTECEYSFAKSYEKVSLGASASTSSSACLIYLKAKGVENKLWFW